MLNNFSFPRNKRLLCKADFQTVFKAGKRQFTPYFVIYLTPNALSHPRIGVIASKRQAKRAVDRNRIRRAAKEWFRCKQADLPPCDWVVVVLKRALTASNQELSQCLEKTAAKTSQS